MVDTCAKHTPVLADGARGYGVDKSAEMLDFLAPPAITLALAGSARVIPVRGQWQKDYYGKFFLFFGKTR